MYAYPSGHNPKTGTQESGMKLRDYFAAMALHGFIKDRFTQPTYEQTAKACYELADEMMKARDL